MDVRGEVGGDEVAGVGVVVEEGLGRVLDWGTEGEGVGSVTPKPVTSTFNSLLLSSDSGPREPMLVLPSRGESM